MKKLCALLACLVVFAATPKPVSAGEKIADEDDEDPTFYMLSLSGENISSTSSIRVKIFPHERDYLPHGKDEVLDQFTIRSENPCMIYRASKDRILPNGLLQKDQNLIKLRAQDMTGPVIVDCPEQFTLERISAGGKPKELSYSGLLYVQVVQKQDKTMLEAINVLSLRGYLRGVVPSEVFHHWPMEALKTQAVAARTYAVYHLVRARKFVPSRLWDVDDTVVYQAYTGISHHKENTDEAVFSTEGQILMYQGQVIQAFYHADSGGSTEEANTIWDQPAPFTVARPEASDLEMNRTVWERSFTLKDLTDEMREAGVWTSERPIAKVVVPMVGQTNSGRVKSVALISAKGEYVNIPNRIFKKVVGGTLPSNLYTVEQSPEGLVQIKGLGFGHGVGMSQQGAAALAGRKAWSYRQILDYYYVRTTLCSIDDNQRDVVPECGREMLKYMRQVASQR